MANVLKRKRDPAFSASEKMCLIELVEKYYNIVESKKTDAYSIRFQNEQWGKISIEFNTISSVHPRDWKVLKNCWENFKKRAKQEQTLRNQHFLATGGGPPRKNIQDPAIDLVLELIKKRASGYVNVFDSDGSQILAPPSTSPAIQDIVIEQQTDEAEIRPVEVAETATDWSQYTPTMLQQNINPALVEPSSPILHIQYIPEGIEATQEQQAPMAPPRVTPVNVASTSRRRPTLRRNENFNTERVNLILMTKTHAEDEHEMQMKILKLQEEKENEILIREKLKTEQEKIKLDILKLQLRKLEE